MPHESVKALANPIMVIERSFKAILETPDSEELVDPDEGWTTFESKGAHKKVNEPRLRLPGGT